MSNYEISKSSLLSLKAEILRKQEEVKNKIHNNERNKRKVPLIIKNKGVDERNERDTVEDLDLLEKSKKILEQKAKLYDKLSKSTVIDDDPTSERNRFLVRFNDKNKQLEQDDHNSENEEGEVAEYYDDPENSDEEWVNYVDCLGRTRTCLKKDLQYYKSRDKDYVRDHPIDESKEIEEKVDGNDESKDADENTEQHQLLSDDMRRELLRQQWEKDELELRDKQDIHYQDILFSEARTHGVGYYSFSKDEEERRKQQESLEKLRRETQKEQDKAQELKATREKLLAARVKAAKMRKRQRLGLPPEEDEEEEDAEIGPAVPQSIEEQTYSNEDQLKERLLEEARRNHIRPWDVGKDKKEFYEYTQQEWVEKQRKERINEFAPPTAYRRDFRAQPAELIVPKSGGSLQFTTKKTDPKKLFNRYKINSEDLEDPFNEETRTFNVHNLGEPVKRKYEEDEAEYGSPIGSTSGHSKLFNSDSVRDDNVDASEKYIPETEGRQNIEASIEEGLKFLRKQSERKRTMRDAENDDMFRC